MNKEKSAIIAQWIEGHTHLGWTFDEMTAGLMSELGLSCNMARVALVANNYNA